MLRSEIERAPDAVSAPMAALLASGGKRLRPALVLLSAKLGHYQLDQVAPAAMAVEITHAATLIHDDVIDRAQLRRGRPTVAASQGNEPAIVIGDYYLVKAYELAARTKNAEAVVSVLALAVMEICAGEVRQHSMRYRYNLDEEAYLRWIGAKTAALTVACCEIGALLGGLNSGTYSALHNYGLFLGFAFQIADDVLDYTGSEDEIGKPIGHDLVEGFTTLPLMLALERGAIEPIADGRRFNAEEALRIAQVVRDSGATTAAVERARKFASQARAQLDALPETEASRTLAALTDYVVSRTF